MRKIKAQPLSKEAFERFGTYASVLEPDGIDFDGFYRDRLLFPVSGQMPVTFSPLAVPKPEKYIVSAAEYHDYTSEAVLPLDDDVVVHVAPASKQPVPEQTEAFLVPKGTMLILRPGTWHLAALPLHQPAVHVLITLPERTYHNDCTVVDYPEQDQIEIEL